MTTSPRTSPVISTGLSQAFISLRYRDTTVVMFLFVIFGPDDALERLPSWHSFRGRLAKRKEQDVSIQIGGLWLFWSETRRSCPPSGLLVNGSGMSRLRGIVF